MPKRKGTSCNKWKRSKKPRENVWRPVEECPRESELFENYYRLQKIVPEEEWNDFIQCLRKDLPTTFRINETEPSSDIIKHNLRTKYHFDGTVEFEGQQVSCVHPIEWCGDDGAWQIDIHRKKLRKVEAFKELHKYLIALNLSGHIGRQEAVSMLPPMFLDVQKDDIVLDMCAAPGSKTLQILEKVSLSEGNGIVVANDADSKRAYLLVHQTSHLKSNHIIVTTHLGQQFPFLRFDDETPVEKSTTTCQSGSFDRILCDVPCSGDGTLRKAPELWKKWNIKFSLALHPLQFAITLRGLKLLKVGGRLVYSTCSLNPIEDEAVVMALVKRCKGAVRVVDVSDKYPKLRRAAGLYDWKVVDEKNNILHSMDEVPPEKKRFYRDTMWPSSQEECKQIGIEHAMRFLPHHQDTGGFFVCVLEKIAEIPLLDINEDEAPVEVPAIEVPTEETPAAEETPATDEKEEVEEENGDLVGITEEQKPFSQNNRKYETLIPWDKRVLPMLKNFYGITDDFNWDLMYSRSENQHILLYVNPRIHSLCIDSKSAKKLKIVNTGLKLFEFNTRRCECEYRICQEGLSVIRKYMTKRIVKACLADFLLILTTQKQSAEVSAFTESTQKQLESMEPGACVFELDDEAKNHLTEKYPSFRRYFEEMGCAVWRGVKNINVLVTEVDIDTMKRVLTMGQDE